MLEGRVALHDVAALKPILEEAGGTFVTRNQSPLDAGFSESLFSANRNLAEALREVMGF